MSSLSKPVFSIKIGLETGIDDFVGFQGGNEHVEAPEENKDAGSDGLDRFGAAQLAAHGGVASQHQDDDGEQSLNTENCHGESQAEKVESTRECHQLILRSKTRYWRTCQRGHWRYCPEIRGRWQPWSMQYQYPRTRSQRLSQLRYQQRHQQSRLQWRRLCWQRCLWKEGIISCIRKYWVHCVWKFQAKSHFHSY